MESGFTANCSSTSFRFIHFLHSFFVLFSSFQQLWLRRSITCATLRITATVWSAKQQCNTLLPSLGVSDETMIRWYKVGWRMSLYSVTRTHTYSFLLSVNCSANKWRGVEGARLTGRYQNEGREGEKGVNDDVFAYMHMTFSCPWTCFRLHPFNMTQHHAAAHWYLHTNPMNVPHFTSFDVSETRNYSLW